MQIFDGMKYRLRNKLGQRTSERAFLVWVFATSSRVYGSWLFVVAVEATAVE